MRDEGQQLMLLQEMRRNTTNHDLSTVKQWPCDELC